MLLTFFFPLYVYSIEYSFNIQSLVKGHPAFVAYAKNLFWFQFNKILLFLSNAWIQKPGTEIMNIQKLEQYILSKMWFWNIWMKIWASIWTRIWCGWPIKIQLHYHNPQCSYRHSHALLAKILRMSYNATTIKFSRF